MSDYLKNAMGAACGVMGWSAQDFWQATPFDFLNAWHGFEQFHGLKPANDLSADDIKQLRAVLNEKIHGL